MDARTKQLIDTLAEARTLSLKEYEELICAYDPEVAEYAAALAVQKRQEVYGTDVYVRGLIEVSNYCKNDCLYCGIRKSNKDVDRFRLSPQQIYDCARRGYDLGFRTFVLQGGEDPWFTDARLSEIVRTLKSGYPDCAVTLSMGERSRESYATLREAGADRYLLRHETADGCHYAQLHPGDMSLDVRMSCLNDLKDLGYTVGVGFMVGSPFQTAETLAKDLKFIERFEPGMCGIGPFLPHHATPFADYASGTVEMTCYLLSLIRLISPAILLPATTALGTICEGGRERGILAGANVVMPNLSPEDTREKYEIYENKLATGVEAAEGFEQLRNDFSKIGYKIVIDKGDPRQIS